MKKYLLFIISLSVPLASAKISSFVPPNTHPLTEGSLKEILVSNRIVLSHENLFKEVMQARSISSYAYEDRIDYNAEYIGGSIFAHLEKIDGSTEVIEQIVVLDGDRSISKT